MEFATEMVIKTSLSNYKVAEVPIILHPDGRQSHAPHLNTFRDGWRTLRFFLMCSPRWLFLIPGAILILLGILGGAMAMTNVTIFGVTVDAHTLLASTLAILLGYQSVLFALLAKTFAISEGILPSDARLDRFFKVFNLEKALLAGGAALLAGLGLLVVATNQWRVQGFGDLDYSRTMRWVIPGVALTALGFQTILSGFLVSILGMRRR
jgi:hypothetical protein